MKRIVKVLLALLLVLVIACGISIWYSYHWLTVSYFTATDEKITEQFRIVLLSDLHDHHFGDENKDLIDMVQEQSPDLIVLNGDMINGDSESDETAVELVRSLSAVAPVYYSHGNHEYYYIEAGHDDLQENLEAAGAIVLNYQSVDIEINGNPIRLGGLYEYGFETTMQTEAENEKVISYLEEYVDTERYLVMCAHRPESFYPWDYADVWGIDLVLSGHLHGGQVILPGIGGIYNTQEGFLPEYDFGHYRSGDGDIIITRGLGTNRKALPRFNNPPEIAVVDVLPE